MLLSQSGPSVQSSLETTEPEGPIDETSSIPRGSIKSTRASRTWTRIFPSVVLLAIILLFVFENLGSTKITFVTFSGTVPLALALFVAAALGGLLVLAVGSIRIVQLRKVIRGYKSTGAAEGKADSK
ncbi:MAG: DUF1049 domain-containing protein [Acidimicrobiaceae bacterium]|nr:DUF1049 domain-containing protein [Acidimicrobiaceae bacterium]